MLDPSQFRELVSGHKRGLGATLARAGLSLLELPYALAMRLRNSRYEGNSRRVTRVGVPVISVGNITTGGTGKTPMVAWLARWFRTHGVRVSVVSRGYGAEHGSINDEALELEHLLPDVPHVQNPDRVAAATIAIEELATQLIVLDDAFQHRRVHRDLDLVLLDALEPFGYGHVLPRGLLRESLAGLRRAQAIVLSRADLVTAERRAEIRETVARYAPQSVWIEATHRPRALRNASGAEEPVTKLQGARVAAFCGIGNPAGFRRTLENQGAAVVAWREFPDHHPFRRTDIGALVDWAAAAAEAERVVCTHKDLVKIGLDTLGPLPLFALQVGIEIQAGLAEFEHLLAPLVNRALVAAE